MKTNKSAPEYERFKQHFTPKREIGTYIGNQKGPNIIFFAGIHGNEWSGVEALRSVVDVLNEQKPDFKGNFYALTGNLAALKEGKRYLSRDLNRIWYPDQILPANEREHIPEYHEKLSILNSLIDILENGRPTVLIDLHTTSAQSIPFISISDTLKNRLLIKKIPVTLVLGLEESLDGPMFSFFSELGLPSVLFEAGQHDAVSSFENQVSFIWLMLFEMKALKKRSLPYLNSYIENLRKHVPGKRKIFEIKYRYVIEENEHFAMKEGFVNFQKIKKGELLARGRDGKILSGYQGVVFMPLYQSQGHDGFFIAKEIKPFWYEFSAKIRKMGLDEYLKLLPGIEKNGDSSFILKKPIRKMKGVSVFHLMGYRKTRIFPNKIIVSRRPYDVHFPRSKVVIANLKNYLALISAV